MTIPYTDNFIAGRTRSTEDKLFVDQSGIKATGNFIQIDEMLAVRTGAAHLAGRFEHVAFVGQYQ